MALTLQQQIAQLIEEGPWGQAAIPHVNDILTELHSRGRAASRDEVLSVIDNLHAHDAINARNDTLNNRLIYQVNRRILQRFK